MKKLYLTFIFLTSLLTANANDVSIKNLKAGDENSLHNTTIVQKAIDNCSASGGGTVLLPAGEYTFNTIVMKNGVNLNISSGCVIKGSVNHPEAYENGRAIIYGKDINNVSITGGGLIDGRGWHENFQKYGNNEGNRPHAIFFEDSNDITVKDLKIRNAAWWTFRLFRCDGVTIDNVDIHSQTIVNNDGIDVDAKNVIISNCRIDSDDDGICLKSDDRDFLPENITITNCIISSNCNPLKLGTSSYCGFKNVTVSNCIIKNPSESNVWDWSKHYRNIEEGELTGLAGIAIESVDGGRVEGIHFANIHMEGVITPIFVCLNERHGLGTLKNVSFTNISAKATGMIPTLISGMPGGNIEDVVLRDIYVTHKGGGSLNDGLTELKENTKGYPENRMYGEPVPANGLFVRHVNGILVDNYNINISGEDLRPAVKFVDVTNGEINRININNLSPQIPLISLLDCNTISITGNLQKNGYSDKVQVEGCRNIDINGKQYEKSPMSQLKNRGLEKYDFFYAGESKKHRMYRVKDGKVVWDYYDPDGKGEISDAVLMSDGNVLVAHQHGIKEVRPDKSVVWSYDTPKGYEIHSAKPIGENHVVFVQCGEPMTAVVMEIPSKKIVKSFPIPFKSGSHGQNRHISLTKEGTLLVGSMDMRKVYEFDDSGNILNEWSFDGVWGVDELDNGNILVTSGNGQIREINKNGKLIWKYDWKPDEKYPQISTQKSYRLDNGNTIIGNWFNEWSSNSVMDRQNPPVQFIEITPSGEIVWELSSWNYPEDLGPATTFQLLDKPVDRKTMNFGKYK